MKRTIGMVLLLMSVGHHQQAGGQSAYAGTVDLGLPDSLTVVLDPPVENMMENYLLDLLDQQFYDRDLFLSGLKTKSDWERHIGFIRDSLISWTGPFPNKTPLNARITGQIVHDDYTVEKVIFESRPQFFVSANLYLPKHRNGRRPAILNVIGHQAVGKSRDYVQRRCIGQAKKGFVALVIDGMGQGERQIPDYSRYYSMPGGVHRGVGSQGYLCGFHIFNIFAWDAIRAVDYLVSRPEVDPTRIGITGTSGGGMLSSYILALEPRIQVAVPTCNPGTYSYHAHAGKDSDHESIFLGCFEAGIDMRGDLLFAHVPKPLLINATTDDQGNPLRGVWELGAWLDKVYAAYGAPEKFKVSMTEGPHGYAREQREVADAWMLRWLDEDPSLYPEGDFEVEEVEALWSTLSGDVYREEGSVEPHDIVLEYMMEHRPEWTPVTTKEELGNHREKMKLLIRDVLNIGEQLPVPISEEVSTDYLERIKITRTILRPETGIMLPGIMFQSLTQDKKVYPEKRKVWSRKESRHDVWIEWIEGIPQGPVVLYLDENGKSGLLDEPDLLRGFLEHGFRVFAVDLRGMGETAPGLEDHHLDYGMGKPIFGQRVNDVRSCIRWLSQPRLHADRIVIWAKGVTALHAAFAAAITDGVSHLVLEEPLISFADVVITRLPAYMDEILVPGVLTNFDLAQVYQAIAPHKVTILNPQKGDGSAANKSEIETEYRMLSSIYKMMGEESNWSVLSGTKKWVRSDLIVSP